MSQWRWNGNCGFDNTSGRSIAILQLEGSIPHRASQFFSLGFLHLSGSPFFLFFLPSSSLSTDSQSPPQLSFHLSDYRRIPTRANCHPHRLQGLEPFNHVHLTRRYSSISSSPPACFFLTYARRGSGRWRYRTQIDGQRERKRTCYRRRRARKSGCV